MDSDAREEDRDADPATDGEHERPRHSDADPPNAQASDNDSVNESAGELDALDDVAVNLAPAESEPFATADAADQPGFGALETDKVDSQAADAGLLNEPEELAASPDDAEDIQLVADLSHSQVEPEAPIDAGLEQPPFIDMSQTGDDEALNELAPGDPPLDQGDETSNSDQAADPLPSEPADVVELGRAVMSADVDLASSETAGPPLFASDFFQSWTGSAATDMREPRPADREDDSRDSSDDVFAATADEGSGSSSFVSAGPTPPTTQGESTGESRVFRMPPLLLEVERADWELRVEKLIDDAAKRMDQIAKDRIDAELSYRDHVQAAQMRALYR